MRRLVIGGPEKYDDTFVDWPDTHYSYNVIVTYPKVFWDEAISSPYETISKDIHTYTIQRIHLGEELTSVWLSNKISTEVPIRPKYWYNLFGCTDKWQRFYDQTKMKYVYQYYYFGKWHTYWEITNEALYRFAGYAGYEEWLIKNLIDQRNEMRCYHVERIDQTVKIGSGDS